MQEYGIYFYTWRILKSSIDTQAALQDVGPAKLLKNLRGIMKTVFTLKEYAAANKLSYPLAKNLANGRRPAPAGHRFIRYGRTWRVEVCDPPPSTSGAAAGGAA